MSYRTYVGFHVITFLCRGKSCHNKLTINVTVTQYYSLQHKMDCVAANHDYNSGFRYRKRRCFFVDRGCLFVLHISLFVYVICKCSNLESCERHFGVFGRHRVKEVLCENVIYIICIFKIREYCMQFLILIGPQTRQTMTYSVLPPSGNSCPTNKIKGVLIGCLLVILP